jgi:predicted MFS family arabinose efflux permease
LDYFRFIIENRRFLAFGVLLAGLSSYGQTFLISLFGGQIRAEFGLSNGDFGMVYSVATLVSGFTLIWLGRQLDRLDLRLFTALTLLGAFLGCMTMATANGLAMLGAAFLLLRICGQGLMMHTAQTSMARYFAEGRGKAVSIATLGLPVGEGVFPAMLVTVAGAIGWRGTWGGMGAVLIVVVLPFALWLLRGHAERHERLLAHERSVTTGNGGGVVEWRRRDVLRDRRFYLVLPSVLAPPFIMTALFFHQVPLAAEKGWTLQWLASCFVGFAASHIAALLLSGPLVDRVGAQRILPFYLLPLAVALLVLVNLDQRFAALAYLMLAGISIGVTGTVMGALWAELYGVKHLGAIRALAHSLMVLSTAVAPGLVGELLDAGFTMADTAAALFVWVILASVLAWFAGAQRASVPAGEAG